MRPIVASDWRSWRKYSFWLVNILGNDVTYYNWRSGKSILLLNSWLIQKRMSRDETTTTGLVLGWFIIFMQIMYSKTDWRNKFLKQLRNGCQPERKANRWVLGYSLNTTDATHYCFRHIYLPFMWLNNMHDNVEWNSYAKFMAKSPYSWKRNCMLTAGIFALYWYQSDA